MLSMTPTRETFGNIPHGSVVLFYWLTLVALGMFAFGIWRRFRLWRQGTSIGFGKLFTQSSQRIIARLKPGLGRLLREGLGQSRVRGRGLASWAHIGLFIGFLILFLG